MADFNLGKIFQNQETHTADLNRQVIRAEAYDGDNDLRNALDRANQIREKFNNIDEEGLEVGNDLLNGEEDEPVYVENNFGKRFEINLDFEKDYEESDKAQIIFTTQSWFENMNYDGKNDVVISADMTDREIEEALEEKGLDIDDREIQKSLRAMEEEDSGRRRVNFRRMKNS